ATSENAERPTSNAQRRTQLERFWPEPAEYCRGEQRVNQAIEKMLERDDPASAAPNRFLDVCCAVPKESHRANNTEYLQECGPRRQRPAGEISGKDADHHTIQKPLDHILSHRGGPAGQHS